MIRIEDDAAIRGLSHRAWRLYHAALCYSRQEGVGEVLPAPLVKSLASAERVAITAVGELLEVGLWEVAGTGYRQLRYYAATPKSSTGRVRAMRERRRASRGETVSPVTHETLETVSPTARVIELLPVELEQQPSPVVTTDDGCDSVMERRTKISAWWHGRTGRYATKRDVDALAGLRLPLTDLIAAMQEVWDQRGGAIAEIGYFWRPMQERESASLKGEGAPRSHGFRRFAGSAPASAGTP